MSETAPSATRKLPLFFSNPVILSSSLHQKWRIRSGNLQFACDAVSVPITVSEFRSASRDYPILFTRDTAAPISLLGLKDQNLSVTTGNRWAEGLYMPAYVRRYPFGAVLLKEKDSPVLMLDAGSDRVITTEGTEEGVPLFDGDEPTVYVQSMIAFCKQFHGDALKTDAFSRALADANLLVDRHADITLPNGTDKFQIAGFSIVDPERFAALPDAMIVDWHRKGWLNLIHLHLASLDRFGMLMARETGRPSSVPHAPAQPRH
ncbi:MAG: SapC family protein [Hyphomonadaceae bacterium]|nr:SapC family protein [Hyphomonadaceae bacterium]